MIVPRTQASRALIAGLISLVGCAKSDVPIDGPTSPVSGIVVPGAAAPGTVNQETAPAMRVQVTLSSGATAADVMTLTIREEIGSGRITVTRNAVQGGGVVPFDPIDVTSLADGNLLLSLDLSNAAGTSRFDFPPVLKDTVAPLPPLRASIPADAGTGEGSVPPDTVNLLNQDAVRVELEFGPESRSDDSVTLTFSDALVEVPSSFAATDGDAVALAPPVDLSGLADGLVTIAGVVADRANNRVTFDATPAAKDTLLAAPTSAVVAETADNPEGFVNGINAGAATVRLLFGADSAAEDFVAVSLADGTGTVVSPDVNPLGGENALLIGGLDLSALADGQLELRAVVRDASGNYRDFVGANVVKDTQLGQVGEPRVAAGSSNAENVVNAASVAAAVVEVELDAAVLPTDTLSLVVEDEAMNVVQSERAALAGPVPVAFDPVDLSGLADGLLTVTVELSDLAGNRQSMQRLGLPKDTLVPTMPQSVGVPVGPANPADRINFTSQSDVTVRVIAGLGDDADRSVLLRVVGGGGLEFSAVLPAPVGGSEVSFTNIDLSGFPEGLVGLEARAIDAGGNESVVAGGAAVLDRSIAAPASALIPAGPDNDENVITAAIAAAVTFRLGFDAGAATDDQVLGALSDGVSSVEVTGVVVGPNADLVIDQVDTSSLADGPVTLGGSVVDDAGNSIAIGPFVFTKDTTSPGAPLSAFVRAGPDNERDTINLASVQTVGVEVVLPDTYEGTEDVRVRLAGSAGGPVISTTTLAPAGGGLIVFDGLDAGGLADGSVALTVEVTDATQNMASYAGTGATKDTLLPEAPTSAGVPAGLSNPSGTINAATGSSATVEVLLPASYVGGEDVSVSLADGIADPLVSDSMPAPAGGGLLVFDGLDATPLADGAIALSVLATDLAGNALEAPAAVVSKDVVAPEILSARIPSTDASPTDTVTPFNATGVTVEVEWGGGVLGSETATVSLADTAAATVDSPPFPASETSVGGLDLSPLLDGPLVLSVTASDDAANESTFQVEVAKRARRTAPRFLFASSPDAGTLSTLHADDPDARMRPAAVSVVGNPGPLALDYEGRFLHVADASSPSVATYRIDPVDASLEPVGSLAIAAPADGLVLHPTGTFLLVTAGSANRVECFRIDAVTGALTPVSNVPAGSTPTLLAVDPGGRFVFVADTGTNELWPFAIDPADGTLAAGSPAPFAATPTSLAVHPSGRQLVVGSSSAVTPVDIDASTGALTVRPAVAAPSGDVFVAATPDGEFVFTASAGNSVLQGFRVSAGVLTATAGPVGLPDRPSGIAVGPSGFELYVASEQASEVQAFSITPGTGVPDLAQRQRVRIFGGTLGVASAERGLLREPRLLYAVHATGQSLSSYAVDPVTGALSINGGGAAVELSPRGLAIDADAGLAYVANEGAGNVTMLRLDPATGQPSTIGQRGVGTAPFGVAFELTRRFLYVSNGGSDSVSMLGVNRLNGGLTTLASPIPTGPMPGWIASDPTGQFVYVVNRGDSTLSGYIIDPQTGLLAPTPTPTVSSGGLGAARAVIHPSGRFLYVTNTLTGDVSGFLIDPTDGGLLSLGQPALAGNAPGPLAVDPIGEYLFVGNEGAGDVTIFDVNPVSGSLTRVFGPTAVVGNTVAALSVDPTGRFVHASEPSADVIVAFAFNRSIGTLSLIESQGAFAGQPSGLGLTGSIQ